MADLEQKRQAQSKREAHKDEAASGKDGQNFGKRAGPTIVKKYANRRLYNTATSSYVTLDHLAEMVRAEEDFVVVDAKSGEDLTRSVLAQIIFEQENRGETMLPVPFLRKLIGLYGNNLQSFVPSYLEASMEAFAKNQEAMRRSVTEAFASAKSGVSLFEEAARKNMAFFEQSMRMFGLDAPKQENGEAEELRALRSEVERLKAALAEKESR